MKIFLRHPKPRPLQMDLISSIQTALEEGKHLLVHAPTGIGKTDAVFAAAIPYIIEERKKLLYLSPKISQHDMALTVLKGIYKRFEILPITTEVIGKRYLCIHPLASKVDSEDFYEICRKLREREECAFYRNFILNERSPEGVIADRDMLLSFGKDLEICPHEAAYSRLKRSYIIIGDYYHLFSPRVREIFIKKIGKELKETVVIIDEAHNLPERIRRVLSTSLSVRTVERAIKEAERVNKDLIPSLDRLKEIISSFHAEKRIDKDILSEFEDEDLWEELIESGKIFLDEFQRSRSSLISVGRFLREWFEGEEGFLRYSSEGKLIKRNLDPSVESEPLFNEIHASVLMSGTLYPPEMYREILGIPPERSILREYKSPFPEENRMVLVVPTLTTRYTRRTVSEYKRYGELLSSLLDSIPGNTAVFFPSYDVMKQIIPFVHTKKPIFMQEEKMTPTQLQEMLNSFRSMRERGAVLMGVAGGSLSEGVDYPGRDLIGVIIVGVPLAEMNLETQALIEYYERKLGKGWTYGYIYPAMVKVVQSLGRLLRSESDRGVMILLDERYTWENYRKFLPHDHIVTSNPLKYIKEFFRKAGL